MRYTDANIVHSRPAQLTMEFGTCFIGFPAFLAMFGMRAGLLLWLWMTLLICVYWLYKHRQWTPQVEWNSAAIAPHIKRIMLRFGPFGLAMILFTWWHDPSRLFDLPRTNPIGWAALMVFYPLMSVIPQEIIFRSFIHRRYPSLFTTRFMLILVSGLTFGWVHVVMNNWVAVAFSTIGGILFADTYERSRSLALTCLEHSIYGCFVFTIGMGWYFYHANGLH